MNQSILIDGEVHEIVPDEARIATETLIRIQHRFGLPDDLKDDEVSRFDNTFWTFVDAVYSMWKALYPHEYAEWFAGVQDAVKYEIPIEMALKKDAGGYFPISYPSRLYNMLHVFFPNIKFQNKKFIIKFLKRHPEFKMTNYAYG